MKKLSLFALLAFLAGCGNYFSVRVWADGGPEISFEESVVKVKTPKNFAGGMFGQLAKGLVERIKNKPLVFESGLFFQQVAENLPNLPKR